MQGAYRQISERRPPNRGNSTCIGKAKPANLALPTLFTKPLAHTFASGSGATQHLGCQPSLRLMVRTYIRKGGHGGDRSKAGMPAGYWQDKGGRAAAATAKAAAKAKELL